MTIGIGSSPPMKSLIEELNERRAERILAAPRRPRKPPKDADKVPMKVRYERRIRSNWNSDTGDAAWNLKHEIADIRSRPELMGDRDEAFLRWLEANAIRPTGEVWLSHIHERRLSGLVRRYTDPVWAAVWKARQAEAAPASTSHP